jgi:hypothetical protein
MLFEGTDTASSAYRCTPLGDLLLSPSSHNMIFSIQNMHHPPLSFQISRERRMVQRLLLPLNTAATLRPTQNVEHPSAFPVPFQPTTLVSVVRTSDMPCRLFVSCGSCSAQTGRSPLSPIQKGREYCTEHLMVAVRFGPGRGVGRHETMKPCRTRVDNAGLDANPSAFADSFLLSSSGGSTLANSLAAPGRALWYRLPPNRHAL